MQSLVWILVFYGLGSLLSALIGHFIPGSVLGMLLLFVALSSGWMKSERVERSAKFLLDHMMLFFIPVTVGLMTAYDLISRHFLAFVVSALLSTVLVILVVGAIVQALEKPLPDESMPEESLLTQGSDKE